MITAPLNTRARKALLVVHLATGLGWFGVGAAQFVIGLLAVRTADPAFRHIAFELVRVCGEVASAPLAILAAATGLLMAALTELGLLRHRWLIVKFALTTAAMVTGAVVLNGLSDRVATETAVATDPTAGLATGRLAVCYGGANLLVLLTVTAISVFRPWQAKHPVRPTHVARQRSMPERVGASQT